MEKPGVGQLIAGAGGALLIVSLFLPWAEVREVTRSGWELLTAGDVFLVLAGVAAILAAVTGGRVGLFRPDLSLSAATDLLGIVASVVIAWLLLFDFPAGAGAEVGIYLALIGAIAMFMGAGDYSVFRGAPPFPRTPSGDRRVR